jgi:hypothetical protein
VSKLVPYSIYYAKQEQAAESFVIELPLNFQVRTAPKLTEGEISLIWSLPEHMLDSIFIGIVELDVRDPDDMLPAFFAYRQLKIPGIN